MALGEGEGGRFMRIAARLSVGLLGTCVLTFAPIGRAQQANDSPLLASTTAPDAANGSGGDVVPPALTPPVGPVPALPIEPVTKPYTGGFWNRLAAAYYNDWHATPSDAAAAHRGFPAPEQSPPYPFSVWPMGGTVWIGYPNAT